MNDGLHAELLGSFGDDLMVSNCARVSMAKHHDTFDEVSDTRMIKYLAREGHWTPFAHPQVQFRIKAPIFVARQWTKHTIGTVRSEISRRYVSDSPEFFLPEVWRKRPENHIKQGSGADADELADAQATLRWRDVMDFCHGAYQRTLEAGIAPEMARMLLPQAMVTEWIETGSLYYWARLCHLRLGPHAQQETKDLAQQVADQIAPLFPVSWAALMNTHPQEHEDGH